MPRVDPLLLAWIESLTSTPAFVRSTDFRVLASNGSARGLAPIFEVGTNLLRATFLDEAAQSWLPDWASAADQVVALVKDEAGVAAPDVELRRLVGELASKNGRFSGALANELLAYVPGSPMHLAHPTLGVLTLTFQQLRLPGASRQTLVLIATRPAN